MIYYEDDMPIYIESPNIKVNKQQNNFDEKDFQYAYIPVGEELLELLIELNFEENINRVLSHLPKSIISINKFKL